MPAHLRVLSGAGHEVWLQLTGRVTQASILDALEAAYPSLEGTIRDHLTKVRRPFIRFFACERDLSHDAPDSEVPEAVADGREPFLIIGAIAGG